MQPAVPSSPRLEQRLRVPAHGAQVLRAWAPPMPRGVAGLRAPAAVFRRGRGLSGAPDRSRSARTRSFVGLWCLGPVVWGAGAAAVSIRSLC